MKLHANAIDLTGQVYGQLAVQAFAGRTGSGNLLWECLCTCGRTSRVQASNLRSGNSTTCGKCFEGITTCVIDGCDKPRYQQQFMCSTHVMRKHRYGDPLHEVKTRKETPSYRAAHARLTTDCGAAETHECVDCGGRAREWSWVGCDEPLFSRQGLGYCVHHEHYEPRCAKCHRVYDHMAIQSTVHSQIGSKSCGEEAA